MFVYLNDDMEHCKESLGREDARTYTQAHIQALSSSSADRPMASGLERGSRSANRLNQADMSLDPPGVAAYTHTHIYTFYKFTAQQPHLDQQYI